jgi:hypothetical protein
MERMFTLDKDLRKFFWTSLTWCLLQSMVLAMRIHFMDSWKKEVHKSVCQFHLVSKKLIESINLHTQNAQFGRRNKFEMRNYKSSHK